MDLKLLLKILGTQIVVVAIVALLVHLISPGQFNYMIWVVFVLVFSLLTFRRQSKTAKELGLTSADEGYQQTTFTSNVKSKLNDLTVKDQIQNSKEYLGEVSLDNTLILKQKWRGVANMSKTSITSPAKSGADSYQISTEPYWKYTLVDGYVNYKAHEELTKVVRGDVNLD